MSVILTAMEPDDFSLFAARALAEYAEGMVAAGEWVASQAAAKAGEVWAQLLPQGRLSENNQFWRVASDGERVGELWLAERRVGDRRVAFILDIYIEPARRRQGYARQTLLAIEDKAREAGCEEMRLHVFGHNRAARSLYERLGYGIASLTMSKDLPRS
ncbi:GNAT family N-acetyltransferase [Pseudomonas chlororaphis]|uniref:GNAT family N-acetyltransferase n=1 Tax=Pseudomonas chlororaphis TaxID=587753 RepID=A0A1Q8EUP6_9PSED|nr:GNAT family N-acetyltransferase [Pseudomonas chlororaphis]OLF55520.1 GNAT family N-acetyltransferase [Pseudomonas chlororaphis]